MSLIQSNAIIHDPCFNLEIADEDDLDPDVMNSMTSLGCFKDKAALVEALLRYVSISTYFFFVNDTME